MRAVHYSTDRRATIPLTVIGGPAGAGKSSLIRHVLGASDGRRIVAIVRDMRSLLDTHDSSEPIPRDIKRDGTHVEWPNGCTAMASDDATATLTSLALAAWRPDHVLVEADGAVNPRRLGGYGYMPGYRPDGTVTVVDARGSNANRPDDIFDDATRAQLRSADVVVLNKLDLAGEQTATASQRELVDLAPSARFLWCECGRVAPALLLGPPPGASTSDHATVIAEWRSDFMPERSRDKRLPVGEHCHSWCLVAERGLESREFRSWVTRLPPSVLRGSGVVRLREEPQHRHEFCLIGARWQLTRGTPWGNDVPATRISLVSIGGAAARPATTRRDIPMVHEADSESDDASRLLL
ncbi:MAG TPA: GTP-binding protein [Gemmatimonadaceae bacterium]